MNAISEQWLQERRTGIGGSDVAAILGLSKWKTPFQVYQEKRGEISPQPDNEAMKWGRYLEPAVRQAYADETGREVRVLDGMMRHPTHAHMLANLDGFTDDRRVFEAKTARSGDGWGEPGTDQVPQVYLLQVQHYLEVTGFEVADVAVLIGGSDFRIYEVPADRELQEMLIEAEAEFWQRVKNGEPPEPVSLADMQARFGRASREGLVPINDETAAALATLHRVRAEREALDGQEEQAKALIQKAMGELDTLVDAQGKPLVTWKASKPAQRFDTTNFKTAHPDLYQAFLKPGEASRRFLLK